MPNHVTTIIEGDDVALAVLVDPDGHVDFNGLIPEPKNIEKDGCTGRHEPGIICWLTWHRAFWGTKWNAYESTVSPGNLRFDTAWRHPEPVILALSATNPERTFSVKYADENLGYNLGHYTIRAGVITRVEGSPTGNGDDASLDFASQVKHGMTYAALRAKWDAEDSL